MNERRTMTSRAESEGAPDDEAPAIEDAEGWKK